MSEGCQQVTPPAAFQGQLPSDLDDQNPLLPVRTMPQFPTFPESGPATLFQPALCSVSQSEKLEH